MLSEGRLNPFPGLRPFEQEEDYLFFGRERVLDELLGRLRATRLLAVVGSSGSGKSSLVRAGAIPSLHGGLMGGAGTSWKVAVLRPGADPIANLSVALADSEILRDKDELAGAGPAVLEATLRRSGLGLADCVAQAGLAPSDNVLVVVDQFEELFRFRHSAGTRSRDDAQAFVRLLLEAAKQEKQPIFILLTMRSDFMGDCMEFPGLPESINQGLYLVPRMTREELKLAIAGPVRVGGGDITPRLVNRLLNEVGDDPDQLPVLQHALMRTWDYWELQSNDGPLDLSHYEVIGSMARALDRHAEEAYGEIDSERDQQITKKLFQALTDTTSDPRGIRRPTSLSNLSAIAEVDVEALKSVIERFRLAGRTFLMPPPGTELQAGSVIDISHESLMRNWERLIGWAKEESEAAAVYLNLGTAAARYQEGTGGLLRDPELGIGIQWRQRQQPSAAWALRYDPAFERIMRFLNDSKRQQDQEVQERDRARRRKLVAAWSLSALFFAFAAFSLFLWQEAEMARSQAEKNLRLARGAVDSMLTEVGEKSLADIPQMEEVRKRLLKQASDFYRIFQGQKPNSSELLKESALADRRLGDIHRFQSQTPAAEADYLQAIKQLRHLLTQYPERQDFRWELARTYTWLGIALTPKKPQDAKAYFNKALEIHKAKSASEPDPDENLELVRTLYNRGILMEKLGRRDESEQNIRKAIKRLNEIPNPGQRLSSGLPQQELARALNSLAVTLVNSGKPADAVEPFQNAVDNLEQLTQRYPDRREFKVELAKILNNWAILMTDSRKLNEAKASNQRALVLFKELARPLPELTSELGHALTTRGEILLALGDGEAASAAYLEAMTWSPKHTTDSKEALDPAINHRYGNLLVNLAEASRKRNEIDEAILWLRLAVHYHKASGASYRENLLIDYLQLTDYYIDAKQKSSAAETIELANQLLLAIPEPRQSELVQWHRSLSERLQDAPPASSPNDGY